MRIGTRSVCARCGQDIEWQGCFNRWRDRGGNRGCAPYERDGHMVDPTDGETHEPEP